MKITKKLIIGIIIFVSFQCKSGDDKKHMKNRLSKASSPYLLQHADNPVDWYEWGEEALTKAKSENKPIIISIGYSACHWCHVMEHESFMDSTVAKYMNENFVSIKIDREERPDIDQIYMNAVNIISGRGGWPLNAFALPNGKPFYALTYLPRNNWLSVLKEIRNAYDNKYAKLEESAESITKGLNRNIFSDIDETSQIENTIDKYKAIFENWENVIDFEFGGFQKAPKFPIPTSWESLLEYYNFTKDSNVLRATIKLLDEMAKGGIYDQIGGGFCRYSTDKYWKVPHFEKMLYDNAQLISLYSHAYQITKNENYAKIIRQSIKFVENELTNEEGGFYSSLNADSEGEEGKFYIWKETEINNLIPKKWLPLYKEYFQISSVGNWEHKKNILFTKYSKKEFAQKHNLSESELETILNTCNSKLLKKRNKRIRPSTDDKILCSWNSLMLKAYTDAYRALGEKKYLDAAIKNENFIRKNFIKDDYSLFRVYKDNKISIEAFHDDYAILTDALISLYEVTFNVEYINLSKNIAQYAIEHFYDKANKVFFYTSNLSEKLIARQYELTDNVIPASNSIFSKVLFKLGHFYADEKNIELARNMLNKMKKKLPDTWVYFANWISLYGLETYGIIEVAVTGNDALNKSAIIQKEYMPNCLFLGGEKENLPLLKNKMKLNITTIYVCKNKVCRLPTESSKEAIIEVKNLLK